MEEIIIKDGTAWKVNQTVDELGDLKTELEDMSDEPLESFINLIK